MIVTRRPLFYGLCLLVGALLFGIAGLNHPMLSGDGAAQLATIAKTGRAAVRMGAFAFSVWSLNILFMVGAGYQLAHAYTASDAGLTGTHAVFIYDMLHPVGLAAERLATFMLGLVAYMFGWAIRNGGVWPKWLAWMAWVVAVVDGVVAVVFSEFSPIMYYGQALFVLWLAVTAVMMLADRRQPT